MATGLLQDRIPGGFSFENCYRLEKSGLALPKATKTGADTRATSGNIVAEKNCEKIHYIADNIYCCGAGTAADTGMTTRMISSKVELHRLNSGRLFIWGYVGAALILGGVDYSGPHLYSVAPHGSSDKLPYVTMGSGSLAAMSVLESRFRFDMDRKEAMQLVRDAIAAGIFNDLGSGSFVDLCVITKDGAQYIRPYDVANKKGQRAARYNAPVGSTAILSRTVQKVEFDVVTTRVIRDMPDPKEEAMDIA
ncbi:N-terminal nucleophile aminohydrolase [Paragonimus heterotremus]|uniref:N-terminal nucleophile aminohydrolase n=1 Tax=Paragonimus heterotremus TaxID=100268 RepID=A0A8J4WLN6_9TREM|nr:N-terminal nucleophile aminohydrolase [Paragonimus heterotremus]